MLATEVYDAAATRIDHASLSDAQALHDAAGHWHSVHRQCVLGYTPSLPQPPPRSQRVPLPASRPSAPRPSRPPHTRPRPPPLAPTAAPSSCAPTPAPRRPARPPSPAPASSPRRSLPASPVSPCRPPQPARTPSTRLPSLKSPLRPASPPLGSPSWPPSSRRVWPCPHLLWLDHLYLFVPGWPAHPAAPDPGRAHLRGCQSGRRPHLRLSPRGRVGRQLALSQPSSPPGLQPKSPQP
jgi:hypothetical protein